MKGCIGALDRGVRQQCGMNARYHVAPATREISANLPGFLPYAA
jgi:hypothetical protein